MIPTPTVIKFTIPSATSISTTEQVRNHVYQFNQYMQDTVVLDLYPAIHTPMLNHLKCIVAGIKSI